jgi:N6-adenosine-specific RNA methylase IME4
MSAPLCIVADPAWQFRDRLPGNGRGASKHYACMDTDGIVDYMRARICPSGDAVLFLWRVAAMQLEALSVADDCGFRVKSELVWLKQTKTGKPAFGMGHYVRGSHETCLICVRGSALPATRSQRSTFSAPVGVHSEKPGAFYRIVEEMYPHSRRIELFSRRHRSGWECHGLEVDKFEAAQ